MSAYTILEEDGMVALFVNTAEKPHENIALSHYKYIHLNDEYVFFRLYQTVYLRENEIKYSMLNWQRVEIKTHCIDGAIHLIDSIASLEEFITQG